MSSKSLKDDEPPSPPPPISLFPKYNLPVVPDASLIKYKVLGSLVVSYSQKAGVPLRNFT
jgi:hypothetical protein